jgi:2-hydroxychromene-2-carboxylate isomerase
MPSGKMHADEVDSGRFCRSPSRSRSRRLREPSAVAGPSEFVFSFRSPYAWIAAQCVLPKLPAMEIRWLPFFPLPEFENFPPPLRSKQRYLVRDVIRLTKFHGLTLEWPSAEDPDWAIPHCAWLHAEAHGRGVPFALEVFAARFSRGEDVASIPVLERAAEATGLDPGALTTAAMDGANRTALADRIRSDFEERDIFGVPTLILARGTRFWGHDRIDWAIREGLIPT